MVRVIYGNRVGRRPTLRDLSKAINLLSLNRQLSMTVAGPDRQNPQYWR